MAENEKKVVNIPELKKRFSNWVKNKLRKAHLGKWHDVDVEAAPSVERELKNKGILVEFRSKIKLLNDLEEMWEELRSKREEIMKLYEVVGFLRYPEISSEESLAGKRGTRINAKDWSEPIKKSFEIEFQKFDDRNKLLLKKERAGLGDIGKFNSEIEGFKDGKHYYSEWVKFKVNINGEDVEEYYPVPLQIPFRFWSSLLNDRDFLATEYLQGYFGLMNINEIWKPEYKRFFEGIIEEAKSKIKCNTKKEEDNLNINIDVLKKAYTEAISTIFSGHVYNRENKIFGEVKTISDKAAEIEVFRNELTQRIPQSLGIKIHFRHTYLTVDPSRIEWPVFGEELSKMSYYGTTANKRLYWKYGEYAKDILKIKKYLFMNEEYAKKERKFDWNDFGGAGSKQRTGETVPGLDENGWPLEVADDNYEWPLESGNIYPRGSVLKDIFNREQPRVVPAEFIVDMDPLLMANCIHNEWDSVRDDLRDGRYHAKSLTVIDYMMAGTPCQFSDLEGKKEWGSINEGLLGGAGEEEFRSYKMYYLDENLTPQLVQEGKRRPSNIIPAFDKRGLGKSFVHLGRKFYYQTARSILEIEEEDLRNGMAQLAIGPHISTRGISQYIITEILSKMKYFDEAKKRLDVIAKKQGVWYDYGPRGIREIGRSPLGPWG